jgi:hypothetical protein
MRTSDSNPLFERYPHLFQQASPQSQERRPTIDEAIKDKEAEYEEEVELYKIYGGD